MILMTESAQPHPDHWRLCNSCKKPIPYQGLYWVCNVSTCNRKRTGLAFCDVSCWDAHVPGMNHRESWAEERKAPSRDEWARTLNGEDKVPRKRREASPAETAPAVKVDSGPKVILRRKAP